MGTSKRYRGKNVKTAAYYGEGSGSYLGGEQLYGTADKQVQKLFLDLVNRGAKDIAAKLIVSFINQSGGPTIIAKCLSPELAFVYGVIGTWYGLDIKGYEWVKFVKFTYDHREKIYAVMDTISTHSTCLGETKSEVVNRKAMFETFESFEVISQDEKDKLIKDKLSYYIAGQLYYQLMNDLEYLIEENVDDIDEANHNTKKLKEILIVEVTEAVSTYSTEQIAKNLDNIYEAILNQVEANLDENKVS